MINFNYEVNPFRVNIIIVFDSTVEAGLQKLIEQHGAKLDFDSAEIGDCLGIAGKGIDKNGLDAWYCVFSEPNFNLGILVHECFHAIYMIAESKGMPVTHESQEFHAYAIENMFNFIKKKYKNQTKKLKKHERI